VTGRRRFDRACRCFRDFLRRWLPLNIKATVGGFVKVEEAISGPCRIRRFKFSPVFHRRLTLRRADKQLRVPGRDLVTVSNRPNHTCHCFCRFLPLNIEATVGLFELFSPRLPR